MPRRGRAPGGPGGPGIAISGAQRKTRGKGEQREKGERGNNNERGRERRERIYIRETRGNTEGEHEI